MTDLKQLPVLKNGVTAHYEGSIDKEGGNADWDWHLYQDDNGEWVLFEHKGAGCIYNFVQHRYPVSAEPTFRFYFDGEDTPRFIIKHSQFGEVYPFVEPIAARYIGPVDNGRGPIRVVRSFVPMPFAKSCKITSDIRLEGFDREKGEGGWGHIVCHAYSEREDVETFWPDNPDYQRLIDLWKSAGTSVIPFEKGEETLLQSFSLKAGEIRRVFTDSDAGLISGIRCKTRGYKRKDLAALKITAVWDGHDKPDVDCPFGCMFANELGYHSVRYLLAGMTIEGDYYNHFPMPYGKSAVIEITNSGDRDILFDSFSVRHTNEYNEFYRSNPFGYFRTSDYYIRRHTEGADSVIATLNGSGHVVGSVITGYGKTLDAFASCEGDARIHFDGIRTPQIESDGSESYVCYGWGFTSPPECNPSSGYDGESPASVNWSMTRQLTGDWYPFLSQVHFAIESGECNTNYLDHSGIVFYYGTDEIRMKKTSEIVIGDSRSEQENGYISLDHAQCVELESYFEGDDDHIPVKLNGRYTKSGCRFTVKPESGTRYVVLRRVSDQQSGRQLAKVYVDGEEVAQYPWYFADHNPYKRWLEDDFVIPSRYISGKSKIHIEIIPRAVKGQISWNEFGYQIYSVL